MRQILSLHIQLEAGTETQVIVGQLRMRLFQPFEEVAVLLFELDKEHFPVIFRIEVIGKQRIYFLIKR